MRQEDMMCQLFNFSAPTYYKRKREGNLAIKFIEKYFNKEDIIEFIDTGKVSKLENLPNLEKEVNRIIRKLNLRLKISDIELDSIIVCLKAFKERVDEKVGYLLDIRSFINWLKSNELNNTFNYDNNLIEIKEPLLILYILSDLDDNEFDFLVENITKFESEYNRKKLLKLKSEFEAPLKQDKFKNDK